jgi:hypothetical protein
MMASHEGEGDSSEYYGVVVVPPSFDDSLYFTQRVEDFIVQKLIGHSLTLGTACPYLCINGGVFCHCPVSSRPRTSARNSTTFAF